MSGIVFPHKADAPLIVDADAPLSLAIPNQSFLSVSGWLPQIVEDNSRCNHAKFATRRVLNIRRKVTRNSALVDLSGFLIMKTGDH